MFYQLPPVGNPVWLSAGSDHDLLLQEVFSPYSPVFYDSGTSALAASILAAISIKGVSGPEVILPAYGCPDLVSAVYYAGANPVLVDLESDRPWMALEQLSAHITNNTVAVIAASLCGIPERLGEIRQITEQSGVLLIEDSAQLFPGNVAAADWQGDLVVLSFGRGKPVSLLGGGAVLYQDDSLGRLLPNKKLLSDSTGKQLAFKAKALLYNRLIVPRCYWILRSFPFLHIGETRYEKLDGIGPLDPVRRQLLESNIERFMERDPGIQVTLSEMIDSLADDDLVNLPVVCDLPAGQRLLRYPLLINPGTRERIYDRLTGSGLGASVMYPSLLPDIPGLGGLLEGQGPFPAAERFSARLLTLPTHTGVGDADLRRIAAIMGAPGKEKTV